jgi:hypothetical protein
VINQNKNRDYILQNNYHFLKSLLDEKNINNVFNEIESERFAKLIGLCCHFCYWCIFGKYNSSPLDDYHLKQLFISMLQTVSALEQAETESIKSKQIFINFTMPMLVLAIRIETDIVFKRNYKVLLGSSSE